MKQASRPALFATVLLSLAAVLPTAAQPLERPHIRVTGSAVTEVQPDYAEWQIQVEATNVDPAKAKATVDQTIEALFEARDDLDVAEEDFETGPASVSKAYEFDRQRGEQRFAGYRISRDVVVRQRDLDAFEAFLADFARENVTFTMALRSSEEVELQRQTRIEAVKAAKAKAEELAEALGVSVNMPLSIDATEHFPRPMVQNRVMMAEARDAGGGADVPYTPGMISFEVTVQATFELAE